MADKPTWSHNLRLAAVIKQTPKRRQYSYLKIILCRLQQQVLHRFRRYKYRVYLKNRRKLSFYYDIILRSVYRRYQFLRNSFNLYRSTRTETESVTF